METAVVCMGGRRCGSGGGGIIAIAFGVGLLISCVCPAELMVTVLAIAMVLMGISHLKC